MVWFSLETSTVRSVSRPALALLFLALAFAGPAAVGAPRERVDLALVLAVDVSDSIDDLRYTLQMNGIARAFEDPALQAAMLSGMNGAMLVALVTWSNRATVALPWTLLTTADDVRHFADEVRRTPRTEKRFTCMSLALRTIADKVLPQMPVPADRVVIDVSGDGRDNCNPRTPVSVLRDELTAADVTINGLPILEGEEADGLDAWYREHVIGGPGGFLIPARGFADFERAIRRKFLSEISNVIPSGPAQFVAR